MNVLIAGDTGLLGQALVRHFSRKHIVLGISRATSKGARASDADYEHVACDALDRFDRFTALLNGFRPELVINSIALADVAQCESDPARARDLNAWTAERIAQAARTQRSFLIHLSTDAVFDGKKRTPYVEEDAARPLNRYGATKLEGERLVRSAHPDALIIRTNIVGLRGEPKRPSFAEWLLRALQQSAPISLADDFVTSSIHVDALAAILENLAQHRAQGLYHVAAADPLSKYAFGLGLAAKLGLDTSRVHRTTLAQLGLKPERPGYLALDTTKASRLLGFDMPSSADTLERLSLDARAGLKEGKHAVKP